MDFPQKIKCLVFHAVCASKELKYVVRRQKWWQKAWAMSAILHNFHYNYGFGFSSVGRCRQYYNANYVKIAWDGFYGRFFVLSVGNSSLLF